VILLGGEERPGDEGTQGSGDPGTRGPRDEGTQGSGDPEIRGPRDPGDEGTQAACDSLCW